MIIANPIYDVVFKRLMENDRVAKFFLSTMIGQKVESLELQPQEFTYEDDYPSGLRLFRLDFMAVVRTDEGEAKKILIEVQKAKEETDLMRFRSYLAEQYKRQEVIEGEDVTLPITTIYILGFKLAGVETACLHVARQYRDMINHSVLESKNDFIECLTHDSYVVQAQRINGKYQTRLDKLLSVFEQRNFIGQSETIKEYTYKVDDEDVKEITAILHHAGTDPETRAKLEKEREAQRTLDELAAGKQKALKKQLAEKEEQLAKKDEQLVEKDEQLVEKDEQLVEKDEQLVEKDEQLNETKGQLVEKDEQLNETKGQLLEKDEQLNETKGQLDEAQMKIKKLMEELKKRK